MKLKIFSDKSYLFGDERYVVLLYPFWGLISETQGSKDVGRFDDYSRAGLDYFAMTSSIADANAVVLPFEWRPDSSRHIKLALELANDARNQGIPLIVFFNNDSDEDIPIENSVIFRTSFYRSSRKPNEFAFPAWSVDFLHRYMGGTLQVRKRVTVPVVGYCGYVDYEYENPESVLRQAARLLTGRKMHIGGRLRGKAVRTLQHERRIQMNFIYRTFFGGLRDESVRSEYVRNIVESDYALVMRGAGNFSYRLYEVLSCGRIPVFVDTDCVLPFDNFIDWKKYCIWVGADDIENIADRIMEFHESISDNDFKDLQISVRRLYEEWISPTGFHHNLWRCLHNSQIDPMQGSKQ